MIVPSTRPGIAIRNMAARLAYKNAVYKNAVYENAVYKNG